MSFYLELAMWSCDAGQQIPISKTGAINLSVNLLAGVCLPSCATPSIRGFPLLSYMSVGLRLGARVCEKIQLGSEA